MRNLLSIGALAGLLSIAASAHASGVYRYVDEDGVTVITNLPPGGSKKAAKMRTSGEVTRVVASSEFKPSRSSADYEAFIKEAAELYRIPPALVRAVMASESNFNPRAVSSKGALGLMQLMPETAEEMFVGDAFDPRQNILGGVRYLRVLANMFDGDMVQIVAAYNAGPEAVKRAQGVPSYPETQEYVKRVLRLYFSYKNDT